MSLRSVPKFLLRKEQTGEVWWKKILYKEKLEETLIPLMEKELQL